MSKAKGSLLVFLRKYLRERGADVEEAFLGKLTPEEQEVYQTALTASWYDVPVVSRLYEVASREAFPGNPDRMRLLGRANAQHDLTGIYKVYLRIASVPMVIKQTARMWRTYHDTGDASVEKGRKNTATLVIADHPTLPINLQEMIAGYVVTGLEMAGGKNVRVSRDSSNARAWRWKTMWE